MTLGGMGVSPGNSVAMGVMMRKGTSWGPGMPLAPYPQPLLLFVWRTHYFSLLLKPAVPSSRTQKSNRGHLPRPLEKGIATKTGISHSFPWYSIFHCLVSHPLSHLRTENARQRIGAKKQDLGSPRGGNGNLKWRTEEERERVGHRKERP